MSNFCIALTTFENKEQAKTVIDTVLEERLAACVQEINIQSHYVWKDELCNDTEVLVMFKTRKDLFSELQSRLLELHSYDTPEIIQVEISDGYEGYLSWIQEMTK